MAMYEFKNNIHWFDDRKEADTKLDELGDNYVKVCMRDVAFAVMEKDFFYKAMEKAGNIPRLENGYIKWGKK